MKRIEALLRRNKPGPPDVDGLLRLTESAPTLATAAGIHPTGDGAVALKPAPGNRFVEMFAALGDLVARSCSSGSVSLRVLDEAGSGHRWVTARGDELGDVVVAVHTLGVGLDARGFGPQLHAAAFAFATPEADTVFLVYTFGRGTFYPLARGGDFRRARALELGIRGAITPALPPDDDPAHRLTALEVPLP